MGILKINQEEIRNDWVLRVYLAFLLLNHLLTYLSWSISIPADVVLSSKTIPICWSFFLNCSLTHQFSPTTVRYLLFAYPASAIFFLVSYLRNRPNSIEWGYWGVLLTEILKILIVIQDYRFKRNHHVMEFWVLMTFLFVANKRSAIRLLVILFYVTAAFLKLNGSWLSGDILLATHPRFVSLFFPWGGWYVLALELVLIWGLLFKSPLIFWLTTMQLALFHLISYTIVGFYYPLLMISLDSLFVLDRLDSKNSSLKIGNLIQNRALLATFSLFIFFQLLPHLYQGNPRIHREGQILSLFMFDEERQCKAQFEANKNEFILNAQFMNPRLSCDPIIFYNLSKELCRSARRLQPNWDGTLQLDVRTISDPTFTRVIDYKGFCSNTPHYNLVFRNDWIRG